MFKKCWNNLIEEIFELKLAEDNFRRTSFNRTLAVLQELKYFHGPNFTLYFSTFQNRNLGGLTLLAPSSFIRLTLWAKVETITKHEIRFWYFF